MNLIKYVPSARRARVGAVSVTTLVALFSAGLLIALVSGAQAAATSVPLGTADSFVVLAGAGVTNTGATTLNGDIGAFPTTSITGSGTLTITGANHAGDAVTEGAKTDLVTAYNTAVGEGPTSPIVADLGGQSLVPGVYNSASSIGLTGALTLDAGGDPSAVWVFQAGSTLTTASASEINLTNGAQACNVFWQIGSSATLGTNSRFRGSILALTSITATTGATIEGRLLARNGAVTLDTNTITKATCTAVTTTAGTTTTKAGTTTTKAGTTTTKAGTTTTKAGTTTKATTKTSATAKKAAAKKATAKKAAAKKAAAVAAAKTAAREALRRVAFTG
ncbi:MAG TPA: ice-binding family protein [Gaiellaceae bacterium]